MTHSDLSSTARVLWENCGNGVHKILLNRPEVRNAFDAQMIADLTHIIGTLSQLPPADLRLLLVGGSGDVFCAGADLAYMKNQAQLSEQENQQDALRLGDLFFNLASFPVPVVCLVQGAAVGGGLGLAACADYVVCDEDALFCTSEVLLGIVPAVISPYIIRKVGAGQASTFMLTGKRLRSVDACRMGLVNNIIPKGRFASAEEEVVTQFLAAGPLASRRTKALIQSCAPLPSPQLMATCAQHIAQARCSSEGQEGLGAFFAKTPPPWRSESEIGHKNGATQFRTKGVSHK